MRTILFVVGFFIFLQGYSQNSVFTKRFDLFSIRIDKKGTWFIPEEADLKRRIGKGEINFNRKIYLHEDPPYRGYEINIDQKFIQNDSMMLDMSYSNNMHDATIIEVKDGRLMVSINVRLHRAKISVDDEGNHRRDSSGNYILEDFNREETAFFLYDLKNRKTLVDDSLCRMEDITAGGYFLRNSSGVSCDDCKFSLIGFDGNQLFPWVNANEILNNREWLFKLHPDAQAFYGIKSSGKTEENQFCFIDHNGKSHLRTFNNFFRFSFKESSDFYFPDYLHSMVKDGKIHYMEVEKGFEKYLIVPENGAWYDITGDSVGTDPKKDFIVLDSTRSLLMFFSDYIIYSGRSVFDTGDLEDISGNDSLDENGQPVYGIISNEAGSLVVFNKKTKQLIHDFNDRFLLDFNHDYYLAGKRTLGLKDRSVTMHYEYFIYDRNFKEIQRTKDKEEFYKLK